MFKKYVQFIAVLLILAVILAACGGQAAPAAAPAAEEAAAEEPAAEEATTAEEVAAEEPAAEEAAEEPAAEEAAAEESVASDGDRVKIRWFVGLGTGTNPEQMPSQEALVKKFNESQDRIELVVEFIDNEQAADQLKTQVASGSPPDIIGPVGQSGVNEFEGLFLDLEPLLEATNYDWSDFDEGAINAYRLDEGTFGIPFAIFPSMIYYNRDLFDEAGLEYPPHKYGEPYADGDPWTVDKLEELALQLTVDANGNDTNSPDFDPENIVQFGYHTQFTLSRGDTTALFGAAPIVDENGNAVIPDRWREAWKWYYSAIHEKHFIPNLTYQDSELLAQGNVFDSGNLAMAHVHLWYTCCVSNVKNWDIAAVPAYNENGDVTVKLHADTFRIFESTEHAEEAFEVMTWLVGDAAGELLPVYGGFPARKSLQEDFLKTLDEKFPQGVDWQVAIDGLAYPDIPNHEGNLPNYSKAFDRLEAFYSLYQADPNLDIDAELDKLESDLQVIFHE
jgi:multiple sugar transport system substrate-binding protein